MATFISVPLKKSSEVELVKPLSKFVTATYPTGEDQAEYIRSVEELNKLRKSALGRPLDKHESSLEILLRYYDQLCAVEPKFPFSENQLCLTFTWKDAFDKGSLFGGSVKLALASLGYEKTCVLFNGAALASQIASEQNLDSDEGLKAAAKYYQLASGAFGHIKDTVLSALNREPTMDISPETVGTLSLIMLAQAQEVFFLKATSDKMKDAIIAKLANQAADFYSDAFKQCQYKENLPKEVLPVLAAKHCIMQANAELHQSILAKQKKHFGEEIARLQHASELVKTVASRYDEYVSVKDLSDKISRALTAAKKDNDFIYHDRVPEVKDLEHIGKAALVKATTITPPLSAKFPERECCGRGSYGVVGLALSGPRIQGASVLLEQDVSSPKAAEATIRRLKAANLPERNTLGFMFACVGRGHNYYNNQRNVEADTFRKVFPNIPLFGFFGNGEIGCDRIVKEDYTLCDTDTDSLQHGYTTVMTLVHLG